MYWKEFSQIVIDDFLTVMPRMVAQMRTLDCSDLTEDWRLEEWFNNVWRDG
jgi:hypothetical protein